VVKNEAACLRRARAAAIVAIIRISKYDFVDAWIAMTRAAGMLLNPPGRLDSPGAAGLVS
jgi:hypothetical protein